MKNKNFISFIVMIASTIILQSCDKIDPPFVDGNVTPPPTSGNSSDVINLQNIKGTVSDFKVTDNWLSDSSALNSVWTVTPTSSGADGTITFTWHEVSATLNISSASGIITFSGPVSITVGGFYGTLSFTYSGSFTSSGSGEGYVAAYVLNKQNILIEDYTGQQCGNCPPAAEKITELKGIYGDRIISITVHAGSFAIPAIGGNMYRYDFRTAVGNELDNFFNPNLTYPNGMINRKIINGSITLNWTSFSPNVSQIITQNKFPDAGIKIENSYTSSDSTLKTKVKTCFFIDLAGTYKVCAYLIEDSIQNWQKDYRFISQPNLSDYWHREVLRGSQNGTWGDLLSPSTKGSVIEKNYTMGVKNEYRAAYCKVVVFIYNDATKEIIQVKEAPIIQ